MKSYIIGVLITIASLLCASSSEAISRQAGVNSQCDTSIPTCYPIPLQTTILCGPGITCPTLSSASFVDTNRFWDGRISCRTSTDGGVTWVNCGTQPFSSGGQEVYAGTSDGHVIGIADLGGTCTIKKSTDNGTNWSTVFTAVVSGCGGALDGGTRLKCLIDGRCDFVFVDGASSPQLLHSDNNGDSWTRTTIGGLASGSYISMAWDGTVGVVTANTLRPEYYTGGVWSQGTAYAACGTISGSVIYNNVAYGICKQTGTSENYRLMSPVTGALFKTITLPGVLTIDGVALAFSISQNSIYVIAAANTTPSLAIGIWVSRDDGVTFAKIFESPQSINGMSNAGDIYFTNGCIYASMLGGSSSMFLKIC